MLRHGTNIQAKAFAPVCKIVLTIFHEGVNKQVDDDDGDGDGDGDADDDDDDDDNDDDAMIRIFLVKLISNI